MSTNGRSSFVLLHHCVPHLKESEGNVIFVSSVNGTQSFAGCSAYCASKAAVDMLARCAAVDLAPYKVRINCVNPGVIRTPLHQVSGMDDAK